MAADLQTIRTKVRRLTRSPSPTQITDAEINEYIDTFILYDMAEHIRLFMLRSELTFYTQPNEDRYASNLVVGDPLFDFDNRIINVFPPFYIDGREAFFTQSVEEFRNLYPITSSIENIGTGDGAIQNFTGTLSNIPILRQNATFTSIDANNNGMTIYDDGFPAALDGDVGAVSTLNRETGVYDITFNAAPANGTAINAHTVPYEASRPTAVLFFKNIFFLRPIPDQPYSVTFQVNYRPSSLPNDASTPELEQWWQYIAYGAAKKIFEDRTDMESVTAIMPEFEKQELLALRKTIRQQSNDRTATIYSGNSINNSWNRDNYF